MACIENIPAGAESEMEEGEIVDELSDISSEEEFLLRQRLEVLENYNNVLERKKAKRFSKVSGKKQRDEFMLNDLSEISTTDIDDIPYIASKGKFTVYKNVQAPEKHIKSHHKTRKKKEIIQNEDLCRHKEHKKKSRRKKRLELKVVSESSDESDDEYRNKRRKLANAVSFTKVQTDKSSLQARLNNMLNITKIQEPHTVTTEDKQTETDSKPTDVSCSPIIIPPNNNEIQTSTAMFANNADIKITANAIEITEVALKPVESIDLCTDDDNAVVTVSDDKSLDTVDSVIKVNQNIDVKKDSGDSDEDLELLRQHALNTKAAKPKKEQTILPVTTERKETHASDDEDSDTTELRLICLKSAFLKKAIEMKQKQKLRKRLQSSTLQDDIMEIEQLMPKIDSENNTDIESVDMEIGSDAEDKAKDNTNCNQKAENTAKNEAEKENTVSEAPKPPLTAEDEFEDDEDLLRAKLLTSLSKNLPNLVNPKILDSIEVKVTEKPVQAAEQPTNVPEEKRIIINVGESDSEGEHEATKNLTKMHIKLSEHIDFQQKLDMFLKSTRMEVENKKLPDVVQKPPATPKFVAKAVNHLPKSEQIEYKNLVKRMAELEKIKQARQSQINLINKAPVPGKDTLKPRNISVDPAKMTVMNNVEEQIALSRKKIAEESSNIMKLKAEATKLSQKYKIVATELKNIATAINLNKKQQRTSQIRLTKIRTHHQRLLNSSTIKHSKINGGLSTHYPNRPTHVTKLQKENDPTKDEPQNLNMVKSMRVSVVNDLNDRVPKPNPVMSIQVDVDTSQKTVIIKKSPDKEQVPPDIRVVKDDINVPAVEEKTNQNDNEYILNYKMRNKVNDDYESPLLALGGADWAADPNAILCPFDVDGQCRDPECKFLHPKLPTQ